MKVSVCILCYNQEKYIEKCLVSVFEQSVGFDFEVVISDDGSTDNSRKIISEVCQRYEHIPSNVIFREENLGYFENYVNTHQHAIGELICSLDGDDYLLPEKLQKQVSFMDSNTNFTLMAHDMISIDENGDTIPGIPSLQQQVLNVEDMLRVGTIFHSSSVIYRKATRVKYEGVFKAIDFYVYIHSALKGSIYISGEKLGAYRVYSASLTSNLAHLEKCEYYYDNAYDLAESYGISSAKVRPAKLKRKFSFALYRCFIGDLAGYKRLIVLADSDRIFASKTHVLLSKLSNYSLVPKFIKTIYSFKRKVMSI
jgi:glycosyltransferase involved in cell wall biosynthesis